MKGRFSEIWLLLLLIAATTTGFDGDPIDGWKMMMESVSNTFQKRADLVKQIFENTGFDLRDLSQDLMLTAAKLFEMTSTDIFQNILTHIQSRLGNASMETLNNNFKKLLHDQVFVRAAKALLAEHDDNPNEYVVAMEHLTETHLKAMEGNVSLVAATTTGSDGDLTDTVKNDLDKLGGSVGNPIENAEEHLTETRLKAMGGAANRQLSTLTLLTGLLGALLAPRVLPWG